MFKKEEFKAIKSAFWEDFRSEMTKYKSSNGKKINWINYPTDISFIYLRCFADTKNCGVSFDIQAKDQGVRDIVWEQLEELKAVLENEMGTEGNWQRVVFNESIPNYDRIIWRLEAVNFVNTEDKERIFAFLKQKLITFDAFYQEFKDILINLVN